MKFNPDLTSLEEPYYYYFDLTYSDLILKTTFHYNVAMQIMPFKKGKLIKELGLCKELEKVKIREMLNIK